MCSERTGRSPEATPRAARRAIDRRDFLKVSGAGLLGVALLGSVGVGTVFAQGNPQPGLSLVTDFRVAAEEYGLPIELLMAMGYVNTRWEMPSPEANYYQWGSLHGWGSYGIMALVQNPFSDTLGEASRLTGIAEEVLKTDRAANIRGGAALLASAAGGYRPEDLTGFFGAIAGRGLAIGQNYTAVSGVGGGDLYAEQVLGVLQTGAARTLSSGETVTLTLGAPTSGIWDPYGW
jgi:hypothetical protein